MFVVCCSNLCLQQIYFEVLLAGERESVLLEREDHEAFETYFCFLEYDRKGIEWLVYAHVLAGAGRRLVRSIRVWL